MNLDLPLELHKQVIYKNQQALNLVENDIQISQEQLLQCFKNGAIWLETTGKPVRIYAPDTTLNPGNKIHLYCNQTTLTPCPHQASLVADFTDFSIWNKPSGMLSQGSKWGDHWALYRWIKHHHWPDRETFITHRLDRFTSGLIIVAHDKTVNAKFHRLFEKRQVQKTYRAIVSGLMTLDDELTLRTPVDQKDAETQLKILDVEVSSLNSLVEIKPQTGRKHQIRIHLSEIGHPVLNDRNYGSPPFSGDLMLQASELEFTHPTDHQNIHIKLDVADLVTL